MFFKNKMQTINRQPHFSLLQNRNDFLYCQIWVEADDPCVPLTLRTCNNHLLTRFLEFIFWVNDVNSIFQWNNAGGQMRMTSVSIYWLSSWTTSEIQHFLSMGIFQRQIVSYNKNIGQSPNNVDSKVLQDRENAPSSCGSHYI